MHEPLPSKKMLYSVRKFNIHYDLVSINLILRQSSVAHVLLSLTKVTS